MVLGDPEIQVRLGAVWKVSERAGRANRLDRRKVDAVVPARDGFAVRNLAFFLDAQIPLVRRDVLEQLLVLAGEGELDPRVRSLLADAGFLIEGQRVLIADEVEQVLDGVDRRGRGDLDDVRIDEGLSPLACDRDAVVAVLHEVRFADLVEVDGGKLRVVEIRAIDALPAVLRLDLSRQECAVEIPVAADTPDDLVDLDLAQATVALRLRVNAAAHLVESEKSVVRAPEPAQDAAHEGSPPRSPVVGSSDIRTHHRSIALAP